MMRNVARAAKPWWTSRTVWLGLLEFAVGLLDVTAQSALTPDDLDGALFAAAGVLTVLFRYLTDQPIDRSRLRPRRRSGRGEE